MNNNFVQISPSILTPRLPELGQIKIGGKGEERTGRGGSKYRLPVKFTNFVITKRERDKDTDNLVVDAALHDIVGKQPTELDVRLLFDKPEQNFQYFLAAYDGRTKRCSGNGETAVDREHGDIPCTCPWLKQHEGVYAGPQRPLTGAGSVVCKPHGRLSVILEAAESFGGFYLFRTTSWETISSIAAQLDVFLQQFGFLSGLPLRLVMYPTTDNYVDESGAAKTSKSYKVALVLRGSFDTARQLAASAYATREQLALPSGNQAEVHQRQLLEDEERDASAIAGEFHPESSSEPAARDEAWFETVEEEDPEAKYLEDVCRLTLEYADWETDRINRQIAKHSATMGELAATLKQELPDRYQKAEEDLAALEAKAAEAAEGEATEEQKSQESADAPEAVAGEQAEEGKAPEKKAEPEKKTHGGGKPKQTKVVEGELF